MKESINSKGDRLLEEEPESAAHGNNNGLKGGILLERSASKNGGRKVKREDTVEEIGLRNSKGRASPQVAGAETVKVDTPPTLADSRWERRASRARSSKTTTPVVATFAEAEGDRYPEPRGIQDNKTKRTTSTSSLRATRNKDPLHDSLSPSGLPAKRSHKKGAGLAAQAAALQAKLARKGSAGAGVVDDGKIHSSDRVAVGSDSSAATAADPLARDVLIHSPSTYSPLLDDSVGQRGGRASQSGGPIEEAESGRQNHASNGGGGSSSSSGKNMSGSRSSSGPASTLASTANGKSKQMGKPWSTSGNSDNNRNNARDRGNDTDNIEQPTESNNDRDKTATATANHNSTEHLDVGAQPEQDQDQDEDEAADVDAAAAVGPEDHEDDEDEPLDSSGEEPRYCYCQQVSYGEMVACDAADDCPREWFHLECVGLDRAPEKNVKWFCEECKGKGKEKERVEGQGSGVAVEDEEEQEQEQANADDGVVADKKENKREEKEEEEEEEEEEEKEVVVVPTTTKMRSTPVTAEVSGHQGIAEQ